MVQKQEYLVGAHGLGYIRSEIPLVENSILLKNVHEVWVSREILQSQE